MGCAHIYDFVAGTTVALAAPRSAPGQREKLDVVRPSLSAADLVARHTRMLEALSTQGD